MPLRSKKIYENKDFTTRYDEYMLHLFVIGVIFDYNLLDYLTLFNNFLNFELCLNNLSKNKTIKSLNNKFN